MESVLLLFLFCRCCGWQVEQPWCLGWQQGAVLQLHLRWQAQRLVFCPQS